MLTAILNIPAFLISLFEGTSSTSTISRTGYGTWI